MLLCLCTVFASAQTRIAFDGQSKPVSFGVAQLEKALLKKGQPVQKMTMVPGASEADLVVQVIPAAVFTSIPKEGFEIRRQKNKLMIVAADEAGAMYALLDVAEQINMGKAWPAITAKKAAPKFAVRAVKFNLPWSPYRVGPAMDQHLDVCRDLRFWQRFLDQMALNRFNLLSLWNVHPFSFMVKPVHFPNANNYTEKEMAEWKTFWTSLFRMAKERGIQPFIVNWNIAVSPEFAKAYGVAERNDTAEIIKRYTRDVVTQVIDEYPDLAGIGITLADWMSNFSGSRSTLPQMTPKDREDWIEETVVAGIKAARRPVQFLHRSVLSSDPAEMRRVINQANLPDTTLVEIKFNWSHGHSTPVLALTHDSHSGKTDNGYWSPMPTNYRIQWMIRNEDFFILRWGQPGFIRQHLAQNAAPYVNGYFVGSEGYIPANDFSHTPSDHQTWDYAFEKQWLFYLLWGRLLYDPATPDAVFAAAFNNRYEGKGGALLLKAHAAASQMPLRLASFHGATWDYTLYSEGFLAPFPSNGGLHDTVSSFISIDEFIDHPTLDPAYVSITDFVKGSRDGKQLPPGKISPLALADLSEADTKQVMAIVKQLRPGASGALSCELDDLETWAYLSRYFAGKLRAGVFLQTFRLTGDVAAQEKAVALLTGCLDDWKKVASITSRHYKEVPYVDDHSKMGKAYRDALRFSWSNYLPQVKRDITLAKAARSGEKPEILN